jgi:hypothetical protein
MKLRDISDCCVHLDVHEKRCDRETFLNWYFFKMIWRSGNEFCLLSLKNR